MTAKEQKTTTFKKALFQGLVKENDYFLIECPKGLKKLFRLVKTAKGYVMWGPPTDKKVLFIGEDGYDNLFVLADAQVKKEYSLPGVFKEVHALGMPEREYKIKHYWELTKILNNTIAMYNHPDDVEMAYILASRCVGLYSTIAEYFVFAVRSGNAYDYFLEWSDGGVGSWAFAVRPEAVPNPTMKLMVRDRDGSKERPWVCISSKEEKQEDDTTCEAMARHSKDELMRLIQEGRKWLEELEEYAKNLK